MASSIDSGIMRASDFSGGLYYLENPQNRTSDSAGGSLGLMIADAACGKNSMWYTGCGILVRNESGGRARYIARLTSRSTDEHASSSQSYSNRAVPKTHCLLLLPKWSLIGPTIFCFERSRAPRSGILALLRGRSSSGCVI